MKPWEWTLVMRRVNVRRMVRVNLRIDVRAIVFDEDDYEGGKG